MGPHHRPSCIMVSDTDCGAVGSGFGSRERHGCLCCNPFLPCDMCFTLASITRLSALLTHVPRKQINAESHLHPAALKTTSQHIQLPDGASKNN
ncbi:hypothetical protein TNCV_2722031 [Trichonephila clavipes]|nr:hypothetical protein TNCV_2722031 [Trichonephila clavipes]